MRILFLQNFLQDIISIKLSNNHRPYPDLLYLYRYYIGKNHIMVEPKGLEPSTSCLQSRCSSQLSYDPLVNSPSCSGLTNQHWWAYLDLNQGPRPYQGRALTS